MGAYEDGLVWQTGVWDRISDIYAQEIDLRFAPVVAGCLSRAALRPGESVLDLGTGTGAAAALAAQAVSPGGSVVAVDLSPEMLAIAHDRITAAALDNVAVHEGRAEAIPADDGQFHAIIASLSMMYVIDREAAARECARVLCPGGRLVAAVWSGADDADIVRFQQTAGAFAPPPPVPGVGPGALANPNHFLDQLAEAGIDATVQTEVLEFKFDTFDQAWEVLAGVTTASLDADRRNEAKAAVQAAMWPEPSTPRLFRNRTQFVVGARR